jgi:hypothetical protein
MAGSGTTDWTIGMDNSDSDKWKVSKGSVLGTNDYLTIDASGNLNFGTPGAYIGFGSRSQMKGSDRISIPSGAATTIFSLGTSGASVGTSSAAFLVNGYKTSDATVVFTDWVLFLGGVAPLQVGSREKNAPGARTYTANGGSSADVAIAGGATYNVSVLDLEQAN